jgi:hypothetical protein
MYFSEAFDIPYSRDHEWFDPILERDTSLFVDPFTIFADSDESWRQAHDTIIDYLHNAFELLAQSGQRRTHQLYRRTLTLMEFPEPREFRLGYASKSADGSGSGPGLATLIVRAMGEAINRGLQDMRHFEELGILVGGINRDRISDITCNLLKPRFITYTQEVCAALGIHMEDAMIPHAVFDDMRVRWVEANCKVPIDPNSGKAILLVPKRFLRELPTINAFDFETALRDDLNLNISRNVRKVDIIWHARSNAERLRDWVTQRESMPPRPYDVTNDPRMIVNWQRVAARALRENPLEEAVGIDSEDDLMDFVHSIVAHFRRWAEELGGWRVFWVRTGDAIPEPNMQLLLLAVLDGYCQRAGVRLDREVETGRGPVDFTFTGNQRTRVLLEMKKLAHGEFWNGLRTQTPLYMRGQSVNRAIFLVVRDSATKPMRERWNSLDSEVATVNAETGLQIEIERVDVLPKPSASKAGRAPTSAPPDG